MFGSEIFDVAIGLALVYLLVSLICSALREAAEGWFKTRAVYLEQGIRQLLRNEGLVQNLYQHPLVYALFRCDYVPAKVTGRHWFSRTNLPAYIPAASFASALLDLAVRGQNLTEQQKAAVNAPAISLENIRKSIASVGQAQVQRALLTAIDRAEGDLGKAHANVEAWYNSAMDRVSGWYKRRTHGAQHRAVEFVETPAGAPGSAVTRPTKTQALLEPQPLRKREHDRSQRGQPT
jgi:hypothetical protein